MYNKIQKIKEEKSSGWASNERNKLRLAIKATNVFMSKEAEKDNECEQH